MSVLAALRSADFAAEHMHHQLQAITDTKHRKTEIEHVAVGAGRVCIVDRGWTTGEDNSNRVIAANFLERGGARKNNREDILFADAARYQLGILRAKVEDNDGLGFHGRVSQIGKQV